MKTSRVFSMLFLSHLMTGGIGAKMGDKPPVILHSHGTFHRRDKLKGWMKEKKRCSFNKNR